MEIENTYKCECRACDTEFTVDVDLHNYVPVWCPFCGHEGVEIMNKKIEITNVIVDKRNNLALFDVDGIRYKMNLVKKLDSSISFFYDGKDKRHVAEDGDVFGYDKRHQKLIDFMNENADNILDQISKID